MRSTNDINKNNLETYDAFQKYNHH